MSIGIETRMPQASDHRKSRPAPARASEEPAIWLRLKSAAALVDLSPGALKQHLYRRPPPSGVVRRFGRAVLIHRERFLNWIEEGNHA